LGYAGAGASALSVLTEGQYFLGSTQDLTEVRKTVEIPVLRKDFIDICGDLLQSERLYPRRFHLLLTTQLGSVPGSGY